MITEGQFLSYFPQFQDKEASAIAFALLLAEAAAPTANLLVMNVPLIQIHLLQCLHAAHTLDSGYMQIAEVAGISAQMDAGSPSSFPGSKGQSDLESTTYGLQFKRLYDTLIPATGFAL